MNDRHELAQEVSALCSQAECVVERILAVAEHVSPVLHRQLSTVEQADLAHAASRARRLQTTLLLLDRSLSRVHGVERHDG